MKSIRQRNNWPETHADFSYKKWRGCPSVVDNYGPIPVGDFIVIGTGQKVIDWSKDRDAGNNYVITGGDEVRTIFEAIHKQDNYLDAYYCEFVSKSSLIFTPSFYIVYAYEKYKINKELA